MNTLGWLLILGGALLVRQLSVGRGQPTSIAEDARDFFAGFLQGDTGRVSEVAARRGTALAPTATDTGSGTAAPPSGGGSGRGGAVASEMKRLGSSAKGYIFGATGPDYYDCSGLAWRAMKNLGIYTGIRFTTHTWPLIAPRFASRVDSPAPGDMAVWPAHHMGVVTGPDQLYSARSTKSGIGTTTIELYNKMYGPAQYWRFSDGASEPSGGGIWKVK